MLSQVIEQSENSEAEQNNQVLDTVANYFMELATFVNDSNVNISATVSHNLLARDVEFKWDFVHAYIGC